MQGYYISTLLQSVQVIRPLLHHLAAFLDELGAVIDSTEGIGDTVGQLVFNHFGLYPWFQVQYGTRHGTESMSCDFSPGIIAYTPQGWPYPVPYPLY